VAPSLGVTPEFPNPGRQTMPLFLTSKDFLAGAIYLLLGAVTIYLGIGYGIGIAGRMGPGYFPMIIGSGLILVGAISIVRTIFMDRSQADGLGLRPLLVITLSLVLFGYFLHRLGLVISLGILLGVAAFAAHQSRFSVIGVVAAVGLIAACAIVFVRGLGLPTPLLGYWLGG
jgi:hypothetical protein